MNSKEWREKKLLDIKKYPEEHKHTFGKLQRCCTKNGVIDLKIMDAHSKYVDLGTNGGVRCDTVSGPCSCGAWH